jgi:uridine kinase
VHRPELLDGLADLLDAVAVSSPTRVAVDGRDAAGKTTLADELASVLRARGRAVIRASIDDFHRPRAVRHALGPTSPEGYYRNAFDYDAVERELLEPLSPEGDRRYRPAVFDLRADLPIDAPPLVAADAAVLLFDGVFLLRPELRDAWDAAIFVSVSADETIRRARARDAGHLGSADEVEARYRARYLPAHELYNAEAAPTKAADLIVLNDEPANPTLVVRLTRGG